MLKPNIFVHQGDLPADLTYETSVAVDSETLGLNLQRDRLCVVQVSAGDNTAHLVQFSGSAYDAPNLKSVLVNPGIEKIFHFARFDIAALKKHLAVEISPIFCTKIASKLVRTYTQAHGLKDLTSELLGVELVKKQQSSDWAATELTEEQKLYAATDVLYLHSLRDKLVEMLIREKRLSYAQAAFGFLPTRASLDLAGFENIDILAHS
ncbi:MAG TPA: Ribonuclease D [Hyphomicrobiaceae bacterium MAG_BT-2024]